MSYINILRSSTSGLSIINIVGTVAVIVIALAVLLPFFAHERIPLRVSGCQANLKQIGNSLKMYLADWDETYPTNRVYQKNDKLGPVACYVKLSKVGSDKATGKAYKFQDGVNWVEGLYNYMEPIVERADHYSVWKCPQSNSTAKTDSAEVSYAFNRNLIEQPEEVIINGRTTMMVSEVDGLLDAELRPSIKSNKNPKAAPQDTFCSAKLHGAGSHILFADGHVGLFAANRFFSNGCKWDAKSKCWFNAGDGRPVTSKAIQITP